MRGERPYPGQGVTDDGGSSRVKALYLYMYAVAIYGWPSALAGMRLHPHKVEVFIAEGRANLMQKQKRSILSRSRPFP